MNKGIKWLFCIWCKADNWLLIGKSIKGTLLLKSMFSSKCAKICPIRLDIFLLFFSTTWCFSGNRWTNTWNWLLVPPLNTLSISSSYLRSYCFASCFISLDSCVSPHCFPSVSSLSKIQREVKQGANFKCWFTSGNQKIKFHAT